jgi:hypothetical protein
VLCGAIVTIYYRIIKQKILQTTLRVLLSVTFYA